MCDTAVLTRFAFVLAVLLTTVSACSSAESAHVDELSAGLTSSVNVMTTTRGHVDIATRCSVAEQMPELVRRYPENSRQRVTVAVVRSISGLLKDSEDCVRAAAAATLGLIGAPAASGTAGELRAALYDRVKSSSAVAQPVDSEAAIRGALTRITGNSVWRSCSAHVEDHERQCPAG